MKAQQRFATFCRMCQGRCSMLVTVEDGKVARVAPVKDDPIGRERPCAKGLALPEILNHPDRLKYPQRRQGERGEGKWARISWDEALTTIAERWKQLKDRFGPECIAIGLGDPKGLDIAFAHRLASTFGTPNISTPGDICHMPGELSSQFTFGLPCFADREQQPRCIVVWGTSPGNTHGGMTAKRLNSTLKSGAKLIVVDPRKTDLASRADLWIRLSPGSDGALALGMIKAIIEEHLYDRGFVARWTEGFDQLEKQARSYSLEEVSELTWVPVEQIQQAARLYAETKPGVILWGNALDHTTNSFQTCRAISILRAISGNVDIPGGELLTLPPPTTGPGAFMLLRDFPRNQERLAGKQFKLAARAYFIPRHSLTRAILEEKPYPIKSALLIATNPLLSYANANETYRALTRLDFLAVADLFMTPTAALADIVLPAATLCEFDEVAPYPSFIGSLLIYPKIVDPPGECWPDTKIINNLAKKLGLQDYFWPDEREALDLILKPSGLNFEQAKSRRYLEGERGYRKYEENGFRTPSGKVEIYSSQLEGLGESPLPSWNELSQVPSRSRQLTAEYPLLLTSAKDGFFCHSAHRNIARLRKKSQWPTVELHPEVARSLGLEEGQWVSIETSRGKIKQRLSLNDSLDPRVVAVSYGWWFPEREGASLYGWNESNVNILTNSNPPHEPGLGSIYLRSFPCRVSRA